MEVTFNGPTDITVVPEIKKTFSSVSITAMVDRPDIRRVVVHTKEIGIITLWQDAEYDAIGQWTDTDVINRIKELYEN